MIEIKNSHSKVSREEWKYFPGDLFRHKESGHIYYLASGNRLVNLNNAGGIQLEQKPYDPRKREEGVEEFNKRIECFPFEYLGRDYTLEVKF